jgi:SH3-like domain-containing protein
MRRSFRVVLFTGALQFLAFHSSFSNTAMIDSLLQEARHTFAPDRRTVVFDVTGRLQGETVVLSGEVYDAALHDTLMAFVRSRVSQPVVDSVIALPHPDLGDRTFGIVTVSAGNIRSAPSHSAELVSQAWLGSPLRVLKKEKSWYYVQTPDQYLGWMSGGFQQMDREQYARWTESPKVIVTSEYSVVRAVPRDSGSVISDVVTGGVLALDEETGEFYQVEYPDGRVGFLPKRDALPVVEWLREAVATPERIVATALRFMGVPYLWGGTSAKGFDCSGFTKTVYFLNGLQLPRDASQQALVGDPVEPDSDLQHAQVGDLLFFGRKVHDGKARVTHVGIYVGDQRFINASGNPGYVLVNSLSPSEPGYSGQRRKTYLFARRIIGAGEESGVHRVSGLSFFNRGGH